MQINEDNIENNTEAHTLSISACEVCLKSNETAQLMFTNAVSTFCVNSSLFYRLVLTVAVVLTVVKSLGPLFFLEHHDNQTVNKLEISCLAGKKTQQKH